MDIVKADVKCDNHAQIIVICNLPFTVKNLESVRSSAVINGLRQKVKSVNI